MKINGKRSTNVYRTEKKIMWAPPTKNQCQKNLLLLAAQNMHRDMRTTCLCVQAGLLQKRWQVRPKIGMLWVFFLLIIAYSAQWSINSLLFSSTKEWKRPQKHLCGWADHPWVMTLHYALLHHKQYSRYLCLKKWFNCKTRLWMPCQ